MTTYRLLSVITIKFYTFLMQPLQNFISNGMSMGREREVNGTIAVATPRANGYQWQ